ncbi:MAG: twin-arginine translocation signal domain-containing protein [Anaerolineae bacterium]|nr:twin-arginine translocation signal domain-containing protein [Anaerolineae bacterium]
MSGKRLTRRGFLQRAGLVGAGLMAALTGCKPKVVEVTKIVEKVVKETVVVQATPVKKAPEKVELVGWTVHGMDPENEKHKPYREAVMNLFQVKYPYATFKHMNMGWDEKLRQNLVYPIMGRLLCWLDMSLPNFNFLVGMRPFFIC